MEELRGLLDQSALTPANFTTLAHFSVSSTISLPKSAGEPTSGVPPRSASRASILGSARPALILVDDFDRRALGRADAVPDARLVAWQKLAHSRYVRQRVRARRGRYSARSLPPETK
jgi:hypothetical protein